MPNLSSIPALSSLRRPNFILFCLCRVLTSLGFQMAVVAIGWLVYDKTHNAYDLGLLGLCQFLPMVLLTFIVGQLADLFDRRRIVLVCQLVKTAALAILVLGALGGWLSISLTFAAVAVLGGARAFEHPTLSALLPAIVPPGDLHRAIAVSSAAMQTATIIGPSLGGLFYAAGVSLPLGVAAACFIAATACLSLIRLVRMVTVREKVTVTSIFSGVAFIRSRPILLGVISLDLFAVLLGGLTALLPIYARDILMAGPVGLGLLRSSPAVGALLVAGLLARRNLGGWAGLKMFAAVIVFGIATVVFAASRNLALSLAALLVLGAADNISVVIRTSLVQLSTPDAMRGRVNAMNSLFIGTSNQLGEFESGMTAGLLGPVEAGILGGIGTIVVALLWMRWFPSLRRLGDLKAINVPTPVTGDVVS